MNRQEIEMSRCNTNSCGKALLTMIRFEWLEDYDVINTSYRAIMPGAHCFEKMKSIVIFKNYTTSGATILIIG